jgi:hypothetical protein
MGTESRGEIDKLMAMSDPRGIKRRTVKEPVAT